MTTTTQLRSNALKAAHEYNVVIGAKTWGFYLFAPKSKVFPCGRRIVKVVHKGDLYQNKMAGYRTAIKVITGMVNDPCPSRGDNIQEKFIKRVCKL